MRTLVHDGRRLAFHAMRGLDPGVVFLGGLRSDMGGTKAMALEEWCREEGRAFLRLDYSGHGASEGAFEEGTVGAWLGDALAVIEATMDGPQVIVGSSLGGWLALLIARDRPDLAAGLVTVAAAPDVTEDGFWAGFDAGQRAALEEVGRVEVPSEYGEPYVVTRRLIEEGRDRLVLRSPLRLGVPVRMLQGTVDAAVPVATALRLLGHLEAEDSRLTLLRGEDHRFSSPEALGLMLREVADVLSRV